MKEILQQHKSLLHCRVELFIKIRDLLQVNLSSFVAVGETKKIKYKNIQRSRIDPIKKYMYI